MFMKIAELEVHKKEFNKLAKEQQLKCVDIVKSIRKNGWAKSIIYSSIMYELFIHDFPLDHSLQEVKASKSIGIYIYEMISKTELEKCCKADGVDYFKKWNIERLERGKVKC